MGQKDQPKDRPRVLGYVRVSTVEQARDGVSLAAQEDRIRGYCDLYNLELVGILRDEGVSAKTLDRPALQSALQALRDGSAAGVVVAKLDRLTRSIRDLGELLEVYFGEGPGKLLFSVADSVDTRTAAGRLVLNVLMTVAQWERETIVERTRDAMDHKRSRGERLGTIPYGWELDPNGPRNRAGRLVGLRPNRSELHWLVTMQRLRIAGNSLDVIASTLNANNVPTRNGKPWRKQTVAAILARERKGGAA